MNKKPHKLVLLRHGQSIWNMENRFTGWTDVDLSEKGKQECVEAAMLLKKHGFSFDLVYASLLKRSVRTAWIVLDEMGLMWVPVKLDWRLNERHYGALQGLDKDEMREKFGEGQVQIWRRSYGIRPPALEKTDPRYEGGNPMYSRLKKSEIPLTESLKDTVKRVLPCWKKEIAPAIKNGKCVLVAASGNSLRGLVKYLDKIPDNDIPSLEIPTGKPLVYELGKNLKPIRHYYLG